MKLRLSFFIFALLFWAGSSAYAQTGRPKTEKDLRRLGMVVMYDLAHGASEKIGVNAMTDTGFRLFGPAVLSSRNGGVIGGVSPFPRWVRVTWRKDVDEARGQYWTTGSVDGDYTVAVLDRIPDEVFNYVSTASGRAIVLRFRLKDDGVLLAWDVQERGSYGFVYKLRGGDF